jgi:hypothetical protein
LPQTSLLHTPAAHSSALVQLEPARFPQTPFSHTPDSRHSLSALQASPFSLPQWPPTHACDWQSSSIAQVASFGLPAQLGGVVVVSQVPLSHSAPLAHGQPEPPKQVPEEA